MGVLEAIFLTLAVTFGFGWFNSAADLKAALENAPKLQKEAEELKKQIGVLEGTIKQKDEQIARLGRSLENAGEENSQLRARLALLEQQLNLAVATRKTLLEQNEVLSSENVRRSDAERALIAEKDALSRELQQQSVDLGALRKEFENRGVLVERGLESAKKILRLEAEIRSLRAVVAARDRFIGAVKKSWDRERAEWEKERLENGAELFRMKAQLQNVEDKFNEAKRTAHFLAFALALAMVVMFLMMWRFFKFKPAKVKIAPQE